MLGNEVEPTKRNVVSIIGKFYDLLGFASPIIMHTIFQQLCQAKVEYVGPTTPWKVVEELAVFDRVTARSATSVNLEMLLCYKKY